MADLLSAKGVEIGVLLPSSGHLSDDEFSLVRADGCTRRRVDLPWSEKPEYDAPYAASTSQRSQGGFASPFFVERRERFR